MSVAATAWAVVPSGMGTLNIMMRKLNADPIAMSGTDRAFTTLPTRRPATTQAGTMAAPKTAQVSGLRYPSGICNVLPPVGRARRGSAPDPAAS